jgi:hypothetical protein
LTLIQLALNGSCRRADEPPGAKAEAGIIVESGKPPLPLLGVWDFENRDTASWKPNDSGRWRPAEIGGTVAYELTAPGEQGSVRAPTSWAVLPLHDVSSFEFSGRMRTDVDPSNPHRDLCVFFHFRDPVHFYYIHISASSDEAHNIVGLVNGADRVKVNREPPGESRAGLTDREWHFFKVTCDAESGEVAVYLDDMDQPILTAAAAEFGHGYVGVGSFDDTGYFDDLSLRGKIFGQAGKENGPR